MILSPKHRGKPYVTSYVLSIGSQEAREAGFLNPDGSSKILKKTVDARRHRIIIEIDPDAEAENPEKT